MLISLDSSSDPAFQIAAWTGRHGRSRILAVTEPNECTAFGHFRTADPAMQWLGIDPRPVSHDEDTTPARPRLNLSLVLHERKNKAEGLKHILL